MDQHQADLLQSGNGSCTDVNGLGLNALKLNEVEGTSTLALDFPTTGLSGSSGSSYLVNAVTFPGYIFGDIRPQFSPTVTSIVLTIFEQVGQVPQKRSVDTNVVYSKHYDNVFVLDRLVVFELDSPVRISTSPSAISTNVRVELNLLEWRDTTHNNEYPFKGDVILDITRCADFEFATTDQHLADCEKFYLEWTKLIDDSLGSNCDTKAYALYQTCIGETRAGE